MPDLPPWIGRGASVRAAALASIACALSWWCFASFQVWTGATLTAYRQHMHDSLTAATLVAHGAAPCGIGLYSLIGEDRRVYGGYTYFRPPTPIYWPKDEAALTAAAAFDTLLYTEPPPALGFAIVRCIGDVCIARRTGGCLPLQPSPLPVPAPLLEAIAAKPTPARASAADAGAAPRR